MNTTILEDNRIWRDKAFRDLVDGNLEKILNPEISYEFRFILILADKLNLIDDRLIRIESMLNKIVKE